MVRVAVEAHPNARANRLELVNGVLRVWVRARAIDGRANAAIEQTLAEALGLRPHQVRLVSGGRSRHKTFEIDIDDLDQLRRRLPDFR